MRTPQLVLDVPIDEPVHDIPVAPGPVAVRVHYRLGDHAAGAATLPVVGDRVLARDIADGLTADAGGTVLTELLTRHLLDPATAGRPTVEDLDPRRRTTLPLAVEHLPSITVAICTRDRPEDLSRALDSLTKVDYPDWEILVVDNAPSDDRTREVTSRHPDVRYRREPRAGLDWARNAAVLHAEAEVVAFLDDDAVADPGWLHAVGTVLAAEPFAGAVTGPVLPAELDTPAQLAFEAQGGFNRGFQRVWWGERRDTGAFGTGANMALRREVFDRVGLFDPALDVGTPTGGGGDLDILYRVVRAGWFVVYEPGAVVHHRHRRDMEGLERQLVGYGGAVGAYFTRIARTEPSLRRALATDATAFARLLAKRWADERLIPGNALPAITAGALRRFARAARCYDDAIRQARREEEKHGPIADGLWLDDLLRVTAPARRRAEGTTTRHVDIGEPLPTLHGLHDAAATHLVVRDGEDHLGQVWIANEGHDVAPLRLATEIAAQLGPRLLRVPLPSQWRDPYQLFTTRFETAPTHTEALEAVSAHLQVQEGGERPAELPTASIVLATFDRPYDLELALDTLTRQEGAPWHEILVVDNHPASGLTPPVVARFPGVRLVPEERQGLAYARNAGIRAATGEIVVCTDDDVRFPATWLRRLLEPFLRRDVMVVCGRVIPLELETAAQCAFEGYGGLDRGQTAWIANRRTFFDRHRVVPTWDLGATANAAFRASIFSDPDIGPFEESLGPGTPTGVGEDTYVFYKVLKAGWSVAYQPAAWVLHRHRRTADALDRQISNYSRGQVSYQLTTLQRDGDLRSLHQLAWCIPSYLARELVRSARRTAGAPPLTVRLAELRGFAGAPLALRRSRRRAEQLGRTTADDIAAGRPTPEVVP